MNTLEVLRRYLEQRASIDPQSVTLEARLEDLGVDSLILIDLMFEMEDKFNVRIPDKDADRRPSNVGELVTLFDSLVAQGQRAGT
jgi:acyl carrier protein